MEEILKEIKRLKKEISEVPIGCKNFIILYKKYDILSDTERRVKNFETEKKIIESLLEDKD